ncbi:MAG: hypothetical protein QXS20_06185 [Candidatus Thorarchaeota archaeon]
MRFILVLPTIRADGKFRLRDLPGSGGRVDILCRSLSACFDWAPETWPMDRIELVAVVGHRYVLTFRYSAPVRRSEVEWARRIQSALMGTSDRDVEVAQGDIETVIHEMVNRESNAIWVLDELGKQECPFCTMRESQENTFIIGDHRGFDERTTRAMNENGLGRYTLGSTKYLSSHCVAIVISELERSISQ